MAAFGGMFKTALDLYVLQRQDSSCFLLLASFAQRVLHFLVVECLYFFTNKKAARKVKPHHEEHSGFLFISLEFFSEYLHLCRSHTYCLYLLGTNKCIKAF